MTVRISKPSFNIRERLSELERPIGVKGNELMRAETAQDARDLVSAGRKNLIINGDMRIDQRNNGSSLSVSGSSAPFSVDRWRVSNGSNAVLTAQRIVDGPSGFAYCLSATITTADTDLTSNYLTIEQRLEGFNTIRLGWGTSQAKYASLSFYVKSSVTGKYGGSVRDADDASSSYTFSYTIDNPNVWEYKTITIPARTTDTWLIDNAGSMDVIFSLATGTYLEGVENTWNSSNLITVPGCVNFAQSVSNNFRITGIQLEVGKNATEFEHRSYGEELALCQRYYYETDTQGSTGDVNGNQFYCISANEAFSSGLPWPVEMRTQPTITIYNLQGADGATILGGAHLTGVSASYITQRNWTRLNKTAGWTTGNMLTCNYTANAEL